MRRNVSKMDFKKLTDEELVTLCKENAPNALDELFNRYKRIVLAVARSYFLSGGDTEDLVHAILIRECVLGTQLVEDPTNICKAKTMLFFRLFRSLYDTVCNYNSKGSVLN